jgi:hypothetical protein
MSADRIIDGVIYEEDGRGSLVPVGEAAPRTTPTLDDVLTPTRMSFRRLADVEVRAVKWLLTGKIPIGAVTLIAGVPGEGKSHLVLDWAARLTRGELEGECYGKPATVVVMSAEDMLEETQKPRLLAAGADEDHVLALDISRGQEFTLPDDLDKLESTCAEGSVRMVILDPLLAFASGGTNTFRESDVRRSLLAVQSLAQRYQLAVIAIMHLNKDVMKDTLSRITSSGAYTAVARSVLFIGADPDSEDELNPTKVVAHGKSNLAKKAPSEAFRIVEAYLEGDIVTSRVEMLGESEVTAEQLVKGRSSAGSKQDRVEVLLRRLCPVHKETAIREAEAMGISRVTVERTFQRMGGQSGEQDRDPETGKMGSTMWRLPKWQGYN